MLIFLYILVGLLSSLSYAVALRNVRRGQYRPNVFSRAVWAALGINSFVGVVVSKSTFASVVLTTILMFGSIAMLFASFHKGIRKFGRLEQICSGLLLVSGLTWILFDQPLVNVALSLLAHFIGAFPTYRAVWYKPRSESRWFWGLFLAGSFLSVVASAGQPLLKQLVPLYYTIFDSSVFFLSLRKKKNQE